MAQRDINQAAINLVKSFEGIPGGDSATQNIVPYLDPVNIWTIGWGHTLRYCGRFLKGDADRAHVRALYPDGITLAQAEILLHADLIDTARDVLAMLAVPVNDNELGALTSFAFNLGTGNLHSSTLLKKLNANDRIGAADQFIRWVRADGKVLQGLVRRRAAERILFLA
jgi:lysozyme